MLISLHKLIPRRFISQIWGVAEKKHFHDQFSLNQLALKYANQSGQTGFETCLFQNKLHKISVKIGTKMILDHLGQKAEILSGPVKLCRKHCKSCANNYGVLALQNKLQKPSVKMGTAIIRDHLGQKAEMLSGMVRFLQKTLQNLCKQFWRFCSPEQTAKTFCENGNRNNSEPPGLECRNANWTS